MVSAVARRRVTGLFLAATGITSLGGMAHAQARWKLTETLRIGGAETGPLSFLYVKGIEQDSKGRILVYDQKTQDIRMFAPDGALVRVIGRSGGGPGEFRNAEGIAIARDGKIWVRDAANARFSVLSAEGEFEKSWTMRFCTSQGMWAPRAGRAGSILDWDCAISGGRATKNVVVAYRTDMTRVDTLADYPSCSAEGLNEAGTWVTKMERGTRYRSIPWAPGGPAVLGADGEVWCAPNSSRYEILRLQAGARDTARISRSVPRVPVTSAERDSVIAQIESKGPTGLDFSRLPKEKPAIDRLTVDDQGRLWVRHTNAKGAIAFDVYSSAGRIIATAELGVYNSSVYQPFVVRGDNVYTVVLDADDVQHVVRFRITR